MVKENADVYTKFIEGTKELAEKQGIEINVKRIDIRQSNDYYNKNRNIFDSSECWFEEIEVDKTAWLLHDYGKEDINLDLPADDVPDISNLIIDYYDDDERYFDDDDFDISELDLRDVKKQLGAKKFNMILDDIMEWVADEGYYNVERHLSDLFNITCPEEEFNEIDPLAYWTIYFEPLREDVDIARECGLFPFEFEGDFYLALGGCGMDLSPKLDAYQALTAGSIPTDSKFGSDNNYAKYVVGEKVYEKVMEKIKLNTPIIHINTY